MTGGGEVLVIGYGNPGRLDDGLGPAAAERVEAARLDGVDVDADYQLTVEDAAAVAAHKVVVFADAAETGPEPFSFQAVEPADELGFSSHSCQPPAVMALAGELFHAKTKGYILGIRGYEFHEFGEALSGRARANLAAATEFLLDVLRNRSFDEAQRRWADSQAAETKEETPCKTENT